MATRSPLELNAQNPHSRSARKCIDCNGHQITLVIRYIWNGIGLPSASLPAGPRSAADLDGKHANYNVFELSLDMNVLLPQNTRFCSHKLRHTFVIPSSYYCTHYGKYKVKWNLLRCFRISLSFNCKKLDSRQKKLDKDMTKVWKPTAAQGRTNWSKLLAIEWQRYAKALLHVSFYCRITIVFAIVQRRYDGGTTKVWRRYDEFVRQKNEMFVPFLVA